MSVVQELLSEAQSLGARFTLSGDKVEVEAPEPLPTKLMAELRQHKSEIISRLRQQAKDSLSQRYEQSFQGEGISDEELAELERRIEAEGFVLCHSELLDDFVAFHRDDVAPATIPAGFVPYSDHELRELFGHDRPDLSSEALKRIHAAKKTGANIISNQPEKIEHGNTD